MGYAEDKPGDKVFCVPCDREAELTVIDDSFDYAGTHCTFGQSGTHHIPPYLGTDCCSGTDWRDIDHES